MCPTNIAAPQNSFVGRADALADLTQRFAAGARVVTVTGVGGLGKTRLALEYAVRHAHDATCTAWFCDLTDARTPDAVASAVARALGIPLGGGDLAAVVGHAIAARGEPLLLLDNAERGAGPTAAVVERWLALAPAARFLVTSRELLGTAAEHVLELAPLDLPARDAPSITAAVQLLLDRARQLRAPIEPTEDAVRELAAIARRLDGLPLALELAAARLPLLGPTALRERLATRLDLLDPGRRAGGARGATLRESLARSWHMLEPWAQHALAQCAVFRGGFAVEAAEHVVDLSAHPDAPPVLDALQALRDRSLIRAADGAPGAAPRFDLFSSVREFGAEQLAGLDPEGAALERHADYFAAIAADAADGARAGRAEPDIERLARERDNLGAAVERVLARAGGMTERDATIALGVLAHCERLFADEGPLGTYLALLDRALDGPAGGAPAVRARALAARGNVRRRLGRLDDARADLAAALALARDARDADAEARALRNLGSLHFACGALDDARAAYQDAAALYTRDGARVELARVLASRASLEKELGNVDDAVRRYAEAARVLEAHAAGRDAGWVLASLGLTHLDGENIREAEMAFERAAGLPAAMQTPWIRAYLLYGFGALHHTQGRLELAKDHYARACALAAAIGDRWYEGVFRGYAGVVDAERGQLAEARAALREAAVVLESLGEVRYAALFRAYEGGVLARQGAAREAGALIEHAERQAEGLDPRDPVAPAVALQRGYLDLAAGPGGRVAAQTRLDRAASDRIAGCSTELRIAVRGLACALSGVPAVDATGEIELSVQREGRWFERRGSTRVDCARRASIRRLLVALAELRLRAPGEVLTANELIKIGWPGERILPEAALNRLYVAINRVRALGLRGLVIASDDGYLLDPNVRIQLVD